jgi:tRNA pseudouridine55 synthase
MTTIVEGLLNVDKPEGITSHDVVSRIRQIGHIRRVGHAGTLDPIATGVLLVCLGRVTRLVEYLVDQTKTYEATVRLGQETNTYDTEGEVVAEQPVTGITREAIVAALAQFQGSIAQQPPLFSAIKMGGQPLYKLARQGIEVERPLRQVTIYTLELLQWRPPALGLRIVCSAGTYIRSLAHDLGQKLGCGGHVTALRRTAIGDFSVDDAVPLATLSADNLRHHLLPGDRAVSHLPRLDLPLAEAERLQQGQRLPRQPHQPQDSPVRVYDANGRFVGIATTDGQVWQPRKIFPATAENQ